MTWKNSPERDRTPVQNFPTDVSDIPQQPMVDMADRNSRIGRPADNITVRDRGGNVYNINHVDNLIVMNGNGVIGRHPNGYAADQMAYDSERRAYERSCRVAQFQIGQRTMPSVRYQREGYDDCDRDGRYGRNDNYGLVGAEERYSHRNRNNGVGEFFRDVNRNIAPIVQTLGLVFGGKMLIDGISGRGGNNWGNAMAYNFLGGRNNGWSGGWNGSNRGYDDYAYSRPYDDYSYRQPAYRDPYAYNDNNYDRYDPRYPNYGRGNQSRRGPSFNIRIG
ncbi:MAG: hypothetical protein IPI39_14775 [Candidatus Obscuribacter sp.]|nr:hypothetical protein [Candidatus Obscuribacter sp.]